jgi:hypothetical protein
MGVGTAVSRTTGALTSTTTSAVGALAGVATTVAGAAGGAAVGSTIGALRGAAQGAADGAGRGSRSTPAVALTVAALGVTGIVDWPLLLAAGGAAYLLQRNSQGADTAHNDVADTGARRRPTLTPARKTPQRAPVAATAKPRKATRPASAAAAGKSTSTS